MYLQWISYNSMGPLLWHNFPGLLIRSRMPLWRDEIFNEITHNIAMTPTEHKSDKTASQVSYGVLVMILRKWNVFTSLSQHDFLVT